MGVVWERLYEDIRRNCVLVSTRDQLPRLRDYELLPLAPVSRTR